MPHPDAEGLLPRAMKNLERYELEQLLESHPQQVLDNPVLPLLVMQSPTRGRELWLKARELSAERVLSSLEHHERRLELAVDFARCVQSQEAKALLQEATNPEKATSIARRAAILIADRALRQEQSQLAWRIAFLEERERQAQLLLCAGQRSAA